MKLETERLLLRPFNKDDIDQVFAMRSDADLMRFIREPQTERKEAESWIHLISSRWEAEGIGFATQEEGSHQ